MITLSEFLKSQETQLKTETAARDRFQKQWQTGLSELFTKIKTWITEADPEKLLDLKEGTIAFYEDETCHYFLPYLEILMSGRVVRLRPIAQNVAEPGLESTEEGQWLGRVDMMGDSCSFELWFFRTNEGEHRWSIRNNREDSIRPLTQKSFESAMVELLS